MRLLLKLAGAAVLVIALVQGIVWYRASSEFAQTAEDLRPTVELEYGSTYAWLNGRMGMRDVRLRSPMAADGEITAERVEIQTSVSGMLSLLFSGSDAPLNDVTFDVKRLRLGATFERSLRERASRLGYLLPYEALGCNDRGRFSGTDYAELGWLQTSVDVHVRSDRDPREGRLELAVAYDMQPLGRFDLVLDLQGALTDGWLWSSIGSDLRIRQAKLAFQDRGMLARRNAFCAGALGIDEAAFVERHMAAVADELESHGVFPDESVTAVYRRFVENGGALAVSVMPSDGVALSDYRHYAPEDRLRLLNAGVQLNEGPLVPVTARFFSEGVGARAAVPDAADTVRIQVDPTEADQLLFEELPDLAGRRIEVKTHAGQGYVGTLLGTQGPLVRLEIVRRSGQPQRLALSRESIASIRLID